MARHVVSLRFRCASLMYFFGIFLPFHRSKGSNFETKEACTLVHSHYLTLGLNLHYPALLPFYGSYSHDFWSLDWSLTGLKTQKLKSLFDSETIYNSIVMQYSIYSNHLQRKDISTSKCIAPNSVSKKLNMIKQFYIICILRRWGFPKRPLYRLHKRPELRRPYFCVNVTMQV